MAGGNDEARALREELRRLRKRLSELTPDLESLLRLRGFRIYKKEPGDDLLLPPADRVDGYYETLKRYSFRLFLRDVIKLQDRFTEKEVARYATAEVTGGYIGYLLQIGLAEPAGGGAFRLAKRPVKSFGETLEWFLAETFRREFSTEAVWGVKFRRPRVGGDYDLIAKINGSILYMEAKSSPPKQIYANEVAAFLDRVEDLNPEAAVFFLDTELRMKDKIVPMFEGELAGRLAAPPPVERMERELFQIWDRIFIINAKPAIAGNIEKVLGWYFRRRK
ncbi:MAG: hypothetical protein Kow0025_05500 [Thermodesulfovibrionales bacterium]